MLATVMYSAGDVRVVQVPDPTLVEPTDAIVRVTQACICGSDLWPYRDMAPSEAGQSMGHEAIGVVEGRRQGGASREGRRHGHHAVRLFRRQLPLLPRRPAHCLRAR